MGKRKTDRVFFTKLCAYSLAVAIMGTAVPVSPVMAVNQEQTEEEKAYETITVASAEDLEKLAENCHVDEWSKNKLVNLTADIDLSGSDFTNIPVFMGIFNGNGHKISNYSYEDEGYVTGFFRYIEEGGAVRNLYLTGNVTSTEDKQCVGAICGINKGTISNCSFQGLVSGRYQTGGIAGINEAGGLIEGCRVKGTVTGYYYTGGIAGKNYGTISSSANSANVNNDSEWVEEDDEISLDIIQNLLENKTDVKLASGIDTGGIAGYSRGAILRCTNSGKIGYEHTGYNIGGIAGRQSGVVALCTNHGEVYGRKDIGGVVGQMEPYIEIDEADSIREAVNRLHDLIQQTLDDMDEGTDVLQRDSESLKSYSDEAIRQGNALSDRLSDFADKNLDEANRLTERMEHVLDLLPDIMDDTEDAGDSLDSLNDVLQKLNEDLNVSDKMSSSAYDETDYRRLSVSTSVGGAVTADKMNPQEGMSVALTDRPENGYVLTSLEVTDAKGKRLTVTQTGERSYTFVMPEENVLVKAVYGYAGAFLAKSNEGGTISVTEKENGELLIKAEPHDGYELAGDSVRIGGQTVALTDQAVTVSRFTYQTEKQPVLVEGLFQRTDTSGGETEEAQITCVSGTGGLVTAGTETAEAGDEVYLFSAPAQGYRLKSLSVRTASGAEIPCAAEAKRYKFVMPDEKVRITAVYEPLQLIVTSNAGGSVSYHGGNDEKVTLNVTPDSGYTVGKVPEVRAQDGTLLALGRAAAGTWSYEFYLREGTEPAAVQVTFQKQSQRESADDALDRINDNAQKLNDRAYAIEETVSEIRTLITDDSGQVREWGDLSREERTELLDCVSRLLDDTTQAGTEASEILSDVALIAGMEMPYIKDAASAAHKDLDEAAEHVQDVLDSLESAGEGLRGIVDYLNMQSEIRFSKLGQEYDDNVDELCRQLQGMTDSIKSMSDHAADYSDKLNADLHAVNNQLNIVLNLLIDKVEKLDDTDAGTFYADVSEEEIETATTGRVDNSYNKGIVQGDINVGGIAGSMAIDTEDPEDNAAGSMEYALGNSYTAKCIIKGSTNQGYVTSKKDGAGGIAGYMKYGVITDCKAYGSVESTEGDYVGGVCGQSLALIKNSYALCTLSGKHNVGGIAGYGSSIRESCSMVTVKEAQGRYGAIAGQTADNAEVTGNYYVGEGLYGIDNISYIGVAEPLTYEELLAVRGLPNDFRHLKAIYKAEDNYLGTQELAYGESLSELELPELPRKEGYYGVWPDVSGLVMTGNIVIEGEYRENVTVVQSGSRADVLDSRENGQGKALALIEGAFTEDTILHVSVSGEIPPKEVTGNKAYTVYELALEHAAVTDADSLSVRLLNPYKKAAVWCFRDGSWQRADSKVRGQYLQTTMNGTAAVFCVTETAGSTGLLIAIAAGAAGVAVCGLLAKKRIGKRKENRRESSAGTAAADGEKEKSAIRKRGCKE